PPACGFSEAISRSRLSRSALLIAIDQRSSPAKLPWGKVSKSSQNQAVSGHQESVPPVPTPVSLADSPSSVPGSSSASPAVSLPTSSVVGPAEEDAVDVVPPIVSAVPVVEDDPSPVV